MEFTMDFLNEQNFSTKHIGHLGLVADKIDELNLIELIDQRLPISATHGAKVSHGERVAAMIFNGLGFIDSRLYLFPEFLEDKAVDRLFNRALDVNYFNDDALGRCLDSISNYGTTKLFTEIAFQVGQKKGLLGKSAHIDTTTLSLYGEYETDEINEDTPTPKQGYAKSGRHDLKQMVLLLATTGAASFPIWMESHSGNASDQKTMPQAAAKIKALCDELKSSPDFMYVGDSAFYENILQHSNDMLWITRVPERIKEAKILASINKEGAIWHDLQNGYAYSTYDSNYGGVAQRWILFFSEAAFLRECKTLDKNVKKELAEQEKLWWHLSNRVFECEKDCAEEIKKLLKKLKYHQVSTQIVPVKKHAGLGRPKKDIQAEIIGFQVTYQLSSDSEKYESEKNKKGRFILSTNQLDSNVLPCDEVLKEYKAQSGTERSFKFIKNDAFQVDSVFLKTPARIEALMMVMTLCLMIYGVSEYDLRQALVEKNETVRTQTKKQTQSPSLLWIYFLFRVVNEVQISYENQTKKIVSNVNYELKCIARYFGKRAQEIYLNSA
jgi:transposase